MHRKGGRLGVIRAALHALPAALLAAASLALAQAPQESAPDKPPAAADTGPKFEIRRFIFQGATLVSPGQLEEATSAFTGKDRSFGDVQRALEVIERTYSDAGYSAVQIVLPEQELEKGEIRFQITEARIGRIVVEGNKFFDEANIRASVPSLAPGKAPNVNEIARNLRIANESPAKQATVLLRSGQEEATIDAVVRVADEQPQRFSVTVDNTGNAQTGRLRVGFGYQNSNLFNLDHGLTLQYVTSPYSDYLNYEGHVDQLSLIPSRKVTILGAGYRIPLYGLGDTLEFSAGWANVNSGTLLGLFTVSGVGGILGARYTRNFDKVGDYEHRLAISVDHRGYHNKGVRPVGGTVQLIPDVTVHPITLLYTGQYRQQDSETAFSFGLSKNFAGGNDGRGTDFCLSRTNFLGHCATGNYQIWRWSVNHNRAHPSDWQMRFAANGQMTRNMLVVGEQFGLGGADSVRGFGERELSNDWGYRGTFELYTPDFGGWTRIPGARARGLFFADYGMVERNQPAQADPHGQSIASVGVGLRFSRGTNVSLRVDYAVITNIGGAQATTGDRKIHASFSYVF